MKTLKSLIFCLIVILGVSSSAIAAPLSVATPEILFVIEKGEPNNTCLDWGSACDLQTALGKATAGSEIWVAAGTYKPTTDNTKTATFQLKTGVKIYGGFLSDGGNWEDRDWVNNETILSGDIGTESVYTDNSYHVVTGSGVNGTAVLDGFTISGGYAPNEAPWINLGGGIYIIGGSPTLVNVTISQNYAWRGGGMYNSHGSPLLVNVTFDRNSAWQGGGMYNTNGSPTLINVSFTNNNADDGGGMSNFEQCYPRLTNITFSNNHATYSGGGLYIEYYSNPTLTNVTFSGNTARWGGGMFDEFNSDPTLTNVTFLLNAATQQGGGIFNAEGSSTLINSILWANTPDQIYNSSLGSATVTYSDIQSGCPIRATCTNIITTDPNLDPLLANNGGFTQTHAFLEESPAIDSGNPVLATCPKFDQRGYIRPINAVCDMGAYEKDSYQLFPTLTVQTIGGGLVAIDPDKKNFLFAEVVTLTATTESGWNFAGWSEDATGTVNPLTVSMLNNTIITANFSQAPVANAGEDQMVATNSQVTLDGSGSSDPDGDTSLTYQWTQTGGTTVTLSDDTASQPTFTAPSNPGNLIFSLVVTDSLGLASEEDTITITVNNQAPVANAGADQSVSTMALITLDGSGSSDPDGDTPLTYQWTQTGGTLATLSSTTSSKPTFTAPSDPRSLTFSLVVTDSLGLASAADEVVITVTNTNGSIYLPLILR